MRRIIFTFICCMLFMAATAQRITRKYNNVSLSEALRQLNEQSEEYTISFLYNELEDFRITTSVHHKTIPEAIRQMIGFYPIRMTIEPGIANPSQQEVIVECPQKSAPRYKGTIIDTADYWRRVERKRFLRHSLRAAARPRTCLIRGLQDGLSAL